MKGQADCWRSPVGRIGSGRRVGRLSVVKDGDVPAPELREGDLQLLAGVRAGPDGDAGGELGGGEDLNDRVRKRQVGVVPERSEQRGRARRRVNDGCCGRRRGGVNQAPSRAAPAGCRVVSS